MKITNFMFHNQSLHVEVERGKNEDPQYFCKKKRLDSPQIMLLLLIQQKMVDFFEIRVPMSS